jgi:hypothetical protein
MDTKLPVSIEKARAAKAVAAERFGGLSGLLGIGITRVHGDYAVKLNLAQPVREGAIPSHLDGVPVQVEVIGSVKLQA